MSQRRTLTMLAALGGCLAVVTSLPAFSLGVSAQTFRAAVDLIAVDVQVTGRDGRPITTLGPGDFEVTLDGRTRRVVSASFTQHAISPIDGSTRDLNPSQPTPLGAAAAQGRTFIIAVDTPSFTSLDVRVATVAAERFTRQLGPLDRVGVVVLPDGPLLPPTSSHAAARQVLARIVGRKSPPGHMDMPLEDIIDITAAMESQLQGALRTTVRRIVADDDFGMDAGDTLYCAGTVAACTEQTMSEAFSQAMALEQDVLRSLAGLDALLVELREVPGRKSVLLLSGGMPVSDRSGGRLTLSNEMKRLGVQVAYANATVDAIFFDPSAQDSFAATNRGAGILSSRARSIYTRALAEFAEPSGGMLLTSSAGDGSSEIDRIVERVANYYLLGVESEARDRDGRPHQIRVRVNDRDWTISHRQLVIVTGAAGP